MRDDISTYYVDYMPTPIAIDDIEKLVDNVEKQLNCYFYCVRIQYRRRSPWYRPMLYKEVLLGRFHDLVIALSRKVAAIRKYTITFSNSNITSVWRGYRNLVQHHLPWMELAVRVKDYGCNPEYAKVTLSAWGCLKEEFALFQQIAVECLNLQISPASKNSFADSLIQQNYERTITNQTLYQQISASVKAKQYDAALRTAFAILEDSLRQKCISAGRSEARDQTGTDLAVTAFHKEKGCLLPPWPIATEAAQGAQLIFQGMFLYLRNGFGHNTTVMGDNRTAVFECLMTVEFLLRVIEMSVPR